jgi:2-Cys peroxiredoxin 5
MCADVLLRAVPGYKAARNEIRSAGIDEVLVYCVNDAAVMEAWAKDQKIGGTNITFFADTSCELSKALDLVMEAPGPLKALGNLRSKRFALYVDNGIVKHVGLSESPDDPAGDNDNSASTAKGMLAAIAAL